MSSNIVVKTEVQKIVVKNADGKDGKSAFQQAVDGGYTGTEQEFNCSLSLLEDVADGKKQISDAINTKGGSSSAEKSLQGIAEDIKEIPNFNTSGFEYVSDIYIPNNLLDAYKNRNYLFSIKDNVTVNLDGEYGFYFCKNLTYASFGQLQYLSGYQIFRDTGLTEFLAPNLLKISGDDTFGYTLLVNVSFPNLIEINGIKTFQAIRTLESALLSSVQFIKGDIFFNCSNLKNIVLGELKTSVNIFNSSQVKLRNITIGQDTNINLDFHNWTATNVIAEGQSGIDELNSNLYNNLLTKLYDHSTDGQTRTLRLGWLAHVTQENIDYANSKGWTLTT